MTCYAIIGIHGGAKTFRVLLIMTVLQQEDSLYLGRLR